MTAIQRYKIHPQRNIIHEVKGLNVVRPRCCPSQNSIADSSTTRGPILDLITGDCWAQCQLRSGIKDISLISKLRKSLTIVIVDFIDTLAIPELDGRFLQTYCSNPESDYGRLLGSIPAMQWYKVPPCLITTHEIAIFSTECSRNQAGDIGLDGRYLHN